MTDWTSARVLELWTAAQGRPGAEAALRLLHAAAPTGDGPGDAARLSLGGRDAALLRLRAALFGPALACVAECPRCAARVETGIGIAELEPGMPAAPALAQEMLVEEAGWRVRCRCVAAGDAPALQALADPPRIAEAILETCVLQAEHAGEPVPPARLPAALRERVAQAIVEADPFAQIRVALTCPDCGADWSELLDPAEYLLHELEGWALRTMRDVHVLARAYGWTEGECLAVPPARRAVYLQMAAA